MGWLRQCQRRYQHCSVLALLVWLNRQMNLREQRQLLLHLPHRQKKYRPTIDNVTHQIAQLRNLNWQNHYHLPESYGGARLAHMDR